MYKHIFDQCCKEFKDNVQSKLREHNNFRIEEDVVKKVQNYPIHKEIFSSCFKKGNLKTLRMVISVFGTRSVFRFKQHRDLSVVAPHYFMGIGHDDLSRGDLVFPVSNLPQPQLPTADADADAGESFRVFALIDQK